MITEIFLVRHGTTEYNAQRRYYGREDVPLNDLGLLQAQYLTLHMSSVKIDVIYSSPLIRAIETIRPYAEMKALPILTDERLVERDSGSMSLTLIKDMYSVVPAEQMELLRRNSASFTYGGPEDARDVCARMRQALDEICERHRGERVCICSHAFSLRMLLASAAGVSPFEYWAVLPNASLSKLVEENGEFREIFVGDTSYLPDSVRQNADPQYVFAPPENDGSGQERNG